ncbi:hypothetical protein D3C86_1713330 [compost metagenome]
MGNLQFQPWRQLSTQHALQQSPVGSVIGDEIVTVVPRVLAHMRQIGDLGRAGFDNQINRVRYRAAFATLAHDDCAETVFAIGQRGRRGEAPVA